MAFERPCVACKEEDCAEIYCEKLKEWLKRKTEYYRAQRQELQGFE